MSDPAYLKILHDKRSRAFEAARAVADHAHTEHRNLTSEENERFDRAEAEVRQYDREIAEWQDAKREHDAGEQARQSIEGLLGPAQHAGLTGNGSIEGFLRGLGGPSLDVSFRDYTLRSPHGVPQIERRDLYGYTTSGSLTVPTHVDGKMYSILTDQGAIWRLGPTIVETQDGAPRQWPATTVYGTGVITPEGTAIAEADPTLSSVTTTPKGYKHLLQLSTEITTDSAVDLVSWVARAQGESLAKTYGPDFATGSGSGAPQGYMTGGSLTVSAAGTCTPDSAIRLQMSVNQNYRRNGKFVTNSGVLSYWRRLRADAGGTTGPWLLSPPSAPGASETLYGAAVVEDSNIAAHGSAVKSVAYGDFESGYLVHQGGPLRLQRSDDYAFANDLVSFRAIWRLDGKVRDANAIAVYQATAN